MRTKLAALATTFIALGQSTALAECRGMVLHAHRGSADAPENSIPSVRLAIEGDWDGVEIDIQQLRDRQWVLHHDPLLGRTTTVKGKRTADIDSAAWREIRLKNSRGRITTEPAPFLDDVLRAVPETLGKVLNIEVKQPFSGSCDGAQAALVALSRARPGGGWFFTSIDRRNLQCARKFDPDGYLGQIVLDAHSIAAQSAAASQAARLKIPVLDLPWLRHFQKEVSGPVGVHVDINTLAASSSLLSDARSLNIAVFTYHLGSDQEHASALGAYARRTGLLPSGSIINGRAQDFCASLKY